MPRLEEVTRADGVQAVLEVLDRDGAVIVRDFLDPDVHRQFRADMEAHASGHRAGSVAESAAVRTFWGEHTTRFTRLAHRSAAFVDILTDPFFLGVADEVLLPTAADYWMNTGQMMIIGPGETAQWVHRDTENWPSLCRPDGFEVTLSCLYAISEFSAGLNARSFPISIAPGAARWPQLICAPSNAGPVGLDAARRWSRLPSTISAFVPTSTIRLSMRWRVRGEPS